MFSIGFEIDIGSWEVEVANCQLHFIETGTYALQLDELSLDSKVDGLF